jgi:hypothetical protein
MDAQQEAANAGWHAVFKRSAYALAEGGGSTGGADGGALRAKVESASDASTTASSDERRRQRRAMLLAMLEAIEKAQAEAAPGEAAARPHVHCRKVGSGVVCGPQP